MENKYCSCCSPWCDHLVKLLLVALCFPPVASRLWHRTCCAAVSCFSVLTLTLWAFPFVFLFIFLNKQTKKIPNQNKQTNPKQSPSSVKMCQTYSEFLRFFFLFEDDPTENRHKEYFSHPMSSWISLKPTFMFPSCLVFSCIWALPNGFLMHPVRTKAQLLFSVDKLDI